MKDNETVQEAIRPMFLSRISDSGDINNLKEKIDLKGFNINAAELKALAEAIKNQNKVTSLNLAFSGIYDEKVKHLATALENNSSLTELDLSGNNIAYDILEAISSAPALASLNLIKVTFDDNVMELLALTTITSLNLISAVTNEEAINFANNLKNNKTLTSFQLGGAVTVDDEVASAFAEIIQENDSLTSLSLSGAYITDRGAQMMAGALKKNHTLKSILLGGNITWKGVNHFATALENNQTLTGLNLSCPNSSAATNLLERNKKIQLAALKISTRKSNRENNKKLEKFKAVVFIGPGLEHEEAAIKAAYGSRSDVKIIVGNMADINFADIDGRTDKDTMFIIGAHGINTSTLNQDGTTAFSHFIEKQPTDKFLNKLKDEVGHDISATLFACHGGGALKFGKINPGITLMTKASSKYTTLVYQGTDTMLKILELKTGKENLSNQDVYRMLPGSDLETYYYRGGNEGDKAIKFPKIIKFSLEEIKNLLEENGFTTDQQNKIYQSFSDDFNQKNIKRNFSNPAIFSIAAIKRKVKDSDFGLNKISRDKFVRKLETEAVRKLSPDNVENFLKNRAANVFKTENVVSEIAPADMIEVLFMACSRGDFGFAELILRNNPNLVNQAGKSGVTAMSAAIGGIGGDNEESIAKTIKMLIKNGVDIEADVYNNVTLLMFAAKQGMVDVMKWLLQKGDSDEVKEGNELAALAENVGKGKTEILEVQDHEGLTALMWAARKGKNIEVIKILLDKGANVNAKDKNGLTAIEWAQSDDSDNNNKSEIIQILKEAKKNQNKTAKTKTSTTKTIPVKVASIKSSSEKIARPSSHPANTGVKATRLKNNDNKERA